jgi:mRNA interferase MazF
VTREIAPWEVWWADFDPQVGREQAGLRLAIVVGTAFACQLPNRLAFVVPCTTTDRQLPFHPQITSLERPAFAMCDQLESVSREPYGAAIPPGYRPPASLPSNSCSAR